MGGRAICATILIWCSIVLPLTSAQLQLGYYTHTCPNAEKIVAEVVQEAFQREPGIAAGLIRILFHDCFVQGCDASLLLDATPSGERTEKNSPANDNLRGLEVVDEAKARLERECPETVSCADTLVFAARESAYLSGVPRYQVPGGRKDGLVSLETNVVFPGPSSSVDMMTQTFKGHGMTEEEFVVLLGAHSIGIAHCPSFDYRVGKYNETTPVDLKLKADDAMGIRLKCYDQDPTVDTSKLYMSMDYETQYHMDNDFYRQLLQGKGLLESDRVLSEDLRTRPIVKKMASHNKVWLKKFAKAMVKLSAQDVKYGTQGEIRKNCRSVNSKNLLEMIFSGGK